MAAPLPLAAGEWLETLLPFLFLLFWIVSQIRSFFRAANQGRPQGPAPVRPQPPRPVTPPPLPVQRPARQPARELRGRRPAAPSRVPDAPLGALGGHGGDVARHVGDAFAHEIRHLESGVGRPEPVATAVPAATSSADIVALLRNPATLRQLVLVGEVLQRPVDRW